MFTSAGKDCRFEVTIRSAIKSWSRLEGPGDLLLVVMLKFADEVKVDSCSKLEYILALWETK